MLTIVFQPKMRKKNKWMSHAKKTVHIYLLTVPAERELKCFPQSMAALLGSAK